MSIPKTPVEFDYDLWTTEEGKCMVRIKATGEITEVERSVMQVLRSEEKRLRRILSSEQDPSKEGKTVPTVLSLNLLPENMADSTWLADTRDYTEEITTKMLERILRESLTPTQYGIYKACILNGISYKAYADQMGVSYQSVQNAIRLIQKKPKISLANGCGFLKQCPLKSEGVIKTPSLNLATKISSEGVNLDKQAFNAS